MLIWIRNTIRTLGAVFLILTALSLLASGDGRTGVERASAWLQSQDSDLPGHLDHLAMYPRDYQRAVVTHLPLESKLTVLKEYLVDASVTHPSFSEPQREILKKLARELDVDDLTRTSYRPEIKKTIDEAVALFGRSDLLFADGPIRAARVQDFARGPWRHALRAIRFHVAEFILGGNIVEAQPPLENCNCYVHTGGNECPGAVSWRKWCLPNTPQAPYMCQNITNGCGLMQLQACNGLCRYYTGPACGSFTGWTCDNNPSCCESTEEGGCGSTWDSASSVCNYGSPILINLAGSTLQYNLTSPKDGVMFDIAGRGASTQIAWTQRGTQVGFLALDRNANGVVDSGLELFGNFTLKRDGSRASNGFVALAELDDNADGMIDFADAAFWQLRLWIDANHDGYSDPQEIRALTDVDIVAIDTKYKELNRRDSHGNWYRWAGLAMIEHGDTRRPRIIFDVILMMQHATEP